MDPDYETYGKSRTPFVMMLKMSLHGLQQSLKNWFGNMEDYPSSSGFHSPFRSDL